MLFTGYQVQHRCLRKSDRERVFLLYRCFLFRAGLCLCQHPSFIVKYCTDFLLHSCMRKRGRWVTKDCSSFPGPSFFSVKSGTLSKFQEIMKNLNIDVSTCCKWQEIAYMTGFYIRNSEQINPNKSDDTKFGLFLENSFNLLLEFLKIYKKVSLLQVPIWFDFG